MHFLAIGMTPSRLGKSLERRKDSIQRHSMLLLIVGSNRKIVGKQIQKRSGRGLKEGTKWLLSIKCSLVHPQTSLLLLS